MTHPSLEEQIDALDRGAGLLDLEGWHLVAVAGGDAERWLNDLVTARIDTLPVGGSVRSLLLGPTGRIRADLLVHRFAEAFALLQSPGQPRPADELLEPYVLSSDVVLEPFPGVLSVMPAPGGRWAVTGEPPEGTIEVGAAALESWRIRLGFARFPVDLDEDSLPAEAGLDEAPIVDRDKGCYLGQESVAKVRNLGHPARVVLAVRATQPVTAGRAVIAGDGRVGMLTSVDGPGGGRSAIARVRWEAREADLTTEDEISLARR